ncbi:MAG: TonB-dependent receptor [Bacteroidales bacterium]|nr:TonB-dependent receptor [Bacteroidales bacterium]
MNKIILYVLLMFLSINVFSDDVTGDANMGTLKGFVFDANTNQPMEYATISMTRKKDNQVVNGTITDQTGFFKIKNVDFGMYRIEITFIGYKSKTLNDVAIRPNDKNVDIGQIILEQAVEKIGEAVVVADRPTMTYKIDKKIINVSQQHTSASGTAVEILENIPSVTVDIDGNVSLRGSTSFTVLIDNKPTVLDASDALSQIPASAIDNIEVITNPSAKYDPDGTSGIINIITKKNKLQGFNGIVNLNVGMYERYGGDFLINWRKERLNVYVGADFNNRNREGSIESENRTLINDTTSYLLSNGDFNRGRKTYNVRTGFDLTLNPQNSINFDARVGNWNMGGSSFTDYQNNTLPVTINEIYNSEQISDRGGLFYSLSLGYNHKFTKKGHEINSLFNFSSRDFEEDNFNQLFDDNNVVTSGQRSLESGPRKHYTFQIDYTLPLRINDKFEAGYKFRIEDSDQLAEMYQYDTIDMVYDYMIDFRHDVTHDRDIHSIYSLYSGEIGKFGYQGGLRGEYTFREIKLLETGESSVIDRWDLFPTVHMSYNLPKDQQVMASYTRRIKRPRGWYFEPFLTWTDAYNVRIGNPDILPEYIDSYELSYLNKFGRNTFSVDAYYRITNNKIERVRSVYDENVYLTSFENVGNDYSLGIELMFGLDLQKWWHIDLMGNIYDYRVEGELDGKDFSESSFNWNARFNNTLRFGKTTRVQFNGMYNSPTITAQGERDGFLMANLAVRQSFYKNKLSATLQARDIFATMRHSSTYEGDDFYSYSYFVPKSPTVTLTLVFKINNYKPDRKRRANGDMEDMSEGEEF